MSLLSPSHLRTHVSSTLGYTLESSRLHRTTSSACIFDTQQAITSFTNSILLYPTNAIRFVLRRLRHGLCYGSTKKVLSEGWRDGLPGYAFNRWRYSSRSGTLAVQRVSFTKRPMLPTNPQERERHGSSSRYFGARLTGFNKVRSFDQPTTQGRETP